MLVLSLFYLFVRALYIVLDPVISNSLIFFCLCRLKLILVAALMQNGIKENPFKILVLRINTLCAPYKRISHIGRIDSEQLMVNLKAKLFCQQNGKNNYTSCVTFRLLFHPLCDRQYF